MSWTKSGKSQRSSIDRMIRRKKAAGGRDAEDTARRTPHARLRRGTAGHADHWLAKLKRRKVLRETLGNISTRSMIADCPEASFVAGAYPTALDLSEATYADLMRLDGVGPKRLTKIRAYLSRNNVPCSWKVP